MRLIGAELLKMRRRTMTYVLLALLIGVMAFVFLVIGGLLGPLLRAVPGGTVETANPRVVYAIVGDFVFGLGSLLAVIYAGAIVGGDYSWGVLRNPIARGESRVAYALAKAAALAIMLALGAVVAFLAGSVMVLFVATSLGLGVANPLTVDGLFDLATALGLGWLVLLERAAIGFAVAVIMRNQLAGIVVAVVLYFAEPILAGIATALTAPARLLLPAQAAEAVHWSQFLPFSVGGSVLAQASASLSSLAGQLTDTVPLAQALPVLLLYLVGSLAVASFAMRRQEIVN